MTVICHSFKVNDYFEAVAIFFIKILFKNKSFNLEQGVFTAGEEIV